MGPSRLWPVSYVYCKIQTRALVREGALHEEASTCQTKEHIKSGHGPQRAAWHHDVLADWLSLANPTPLYSTEQNSEKEFKRRVRCISRIKGQFKGRSSSSSEKAVRVGILEPSEPSRLVRLGGRVGPVTPSGTRGTASARQQLLNKLFRVIVICCGL
jgi:hypothetical protein